MSSRSVWDSGKPCAPRSRSRTSAEFPSVLPVRRGTPSNRLKISPTLAVDPRAAGRGRENRRETKFGSIDGDLEQCFVQEMQVSILPPYVDDESDRRTHSCDVGEVLLGTDADVDAAPWTKPSGILGDVRLVGDEVVRDGEGPGWFRDGRNQIPIVPVADPVRDRRAHADAGQHECGQKPTQPDASQPRRFCTAFLPGSSRR